jgi:hypothetical protein
LLGPDPAIDRILDSSGSSTSQQGCDLDLHQTLKSGVSRG